ncbi:hypothetical protein [Streptomyces sp. NRRL B-3648]|nr:hypothetical protein [Streptomyces sp. NRRL B-3648]
MLAASSAAGPADDAAGSRGRFAQEAVPGATAAQARGLSPW